jgi:Thrombospondin type 3 repeat
MIMSKTALAAGLLVLTGLLVASRPAEADGRASVSFVEARAPARGPAQLVAALGTGIVADADHDGVPDGADNCPAVPNPNQLDTDADGLGDVCDDCAAIADPGQGDIDADGIGDVCDNCPADFNPSQYDADGDGYGGACDPECVTIQRGVDGDAFDASIASTRKSTTYGANVALISGLADGGTRHALLKFDMSPVPPGVVIASATVTLHEVNNGAATIRVHRVTAPWSEASLTWVSFAGAYDASVSTSFSNGGASYAGPVSFDVTSLAWAWKSGQNDGLLLEEDAAKTTFTSSEGASVAQRPRLDVCYTIPE